MMNPAKATLLKANPSVNPGVIRPRVTALPLKPSASAPTSSHGGAVVGGEERRRSQRVLLRVRAVVHLTWQGVSSSVEVSTVNVNVHGALVVMKQGLPVGTRLVLEHSGTKERMACRIVRPARETSDGFHTELEFDSPAPSFWKIAFPPVNWRPEDS